MNRVIVGVNTPGDVHGPERHDRCASFAWLDETPNVKKASECEHPEASSLPRRQDVKQIASLGSLCLFSNRSCFGRCRWHGFYRSCFGRCRWARLLQELLRQVPFPLEPFLQELQLRQRSRNSRRSRGLADKPEPELPSSFALERKRCRFPELAR